MFISYIYYWFYNDLYFSPAAITSQTMLTTYSTSSISSIQTFFLKTPDWSHTISSYHLASSYSSAHISFHKFWYFPAWYFLIYFFCNCNRNSNNYLFWHLKIIISNRDPSDTLPGYVIYGVGLTTTILRCFFGFWWLYCFWAYVHYFIFGLRFQFLL
jgi:hypothetical protein